jgi:hypothetical protein
MPLHGLRELPEELRVGGGFRSVQTYVDTPKVRQGRFFLMQADLDLGWVTDNWTVVGALGMDMGSPDNQDDNELISPRHYAMIPIEKIFNVRLGKFMKNYGLNIPNHTAQIKRGLGWDEGSETYNAEFNVFDEDYTVALTFIGGRPDDKSIASEQGLAITANYIMLNPALRLGASYLITRTTEQSNREVFGPSFTWGVNKKIYLMGEYDWIRIAPASGDLIEGYVTYTRGGWELLRGLDLTATVESKLNDRKESALSYFAYGPGIMWTPRPHFNLTGEWKKQNKPSTSAKTTDSAWLVMQYWI